MLAYNSVNLLSTLAQLTVTFFSFLFCQPALHFCTVDRDIYIFFHLTLSRWASFHPAYTVVTITKDLSISPRFTPYDFLSRCKFSTLLQLVNQWLNFTYSPSFSRFPLRKKKHKSYFDKNRTHDLRTSRCVGYLLLIDHSGDAI